MTKNGMKLMDSDMHIIEPPDLWERYIDPAFKSQAPRRWPGPENPSVLEVGGKVYPNRPINLRPTTRPCTASSPGAMPMPF